MDGNSIVGVAGPYPYILSEPNIPYMYHCHVLFHEDAGMMGQFAVVAPGQSPGTPPSHDSGAAHVGH